MDRELTGQDRQKTYRVGGYGLDPINMISLHHNIKIYLALKVEQFLDLSTLQ